MNTTHRGIPIDELRLIEDIYDVTDEWENVPLRMAPFDMFGVTSYPECVMDVRDLVMGREFRRLHPPPVNTSFNCEPFRPLKRPWWRVIINRLTNKYF